MSPRFRPPGRTLKERWPQEAEERRYFAATTYAVVLGGLLGLVMAPLALWRFFSVTPMALAVIVALLILVTLVIGRMDERGRRWLALAWKIGAWVVAATALGFVFESIAFAICGDGCRATSPRMPPSGLLLTYALQLVGSVGIALLADRWGNALRRRPSSLVTPA